MASSAWVLSDSEDSEAAPPSDGCGSAVGGLCAVGGGGAAADTPAPRSARGRPRGIFGSKAARQARDRALAASGAPAAEPLRSSPAHPLLVAVCEKPDMIRQVLLGAVLHDPTLSLVSTCVASGLGGRSDPTTDRHIDQCLGDEERVVTTLTAEARNVGMPRQTFSRRTLELGAFVFFAARAWAASLCSMLRLRVAEGPPGAKGV